MHDVIVAAALNGPTAGHVESIIAGVGLVLTVVGLALALALGIARRGRPLRFLAGGVMALVATVLLLSFL